MERERESTRECVTGRLVDRWMESVCGIDREIDEVRGSVTGTLTD